MIVTKHVKDGLPSELILRQTKKIIKSKCFLSVRLQLVLCCAALAKLVGYYDGITPGML
jgi:hypothetical protein